MGRLWCEMPDGSWDPRPTDGLGLPGVRLCPSPKGARGLALLAGPAVWVRVNGEPILGGMRLLEHKDEVLIDGSRFLYSAETAPEVVAYRVPEGGRPATCPVCRGPIRDGMRAVACPGCGRWFHQLDATADTPAKPCWTYAPACRFCSHPTAFGGGAAWRPDREEEDALRA